MKKILIRSTSILGFMLIGVFLIAPSGHAIEDVEVCFYQPDAVVQSMEGASRSAQGFMDYLNEKLDMDKKGQRFVFKYFTRAEDLDRYLDTHNVEFTITNPTYYIDRYKKYKLVPIMVPVRNQRPW